MANNGVRQHSIGVTLRQGIAAFAIAGFSLGLVPLAASANLFRTNDYEACTRRLIDDGIAVEAASLACAAALEPTDISACVDRITDGTDIAPEDALDSCIQVRRPRETASCVVRIANNVESVVSLEAMEQCTRSLLPEDYSDCVVGIEDATDLSAAELLETCIAADYRIPSFYPNFEPAIDEDDEDIIIQ